MIPNTNKKKSKDNTLGTGLKLLGAGAGTYGLSQLLLNNKETGSLNTFRSQSSGWGDATQDARKNLLEYVHSGSDVLNSHPMGVDPVNLMKTVRNPWLVKNTRFEPFAWKPDSGTHYTEFQKSPLDGYMQLQKEVVHGDHGQALGNYNSLRSLTQQGVYGNPDYQHIADAAKNWMGFSPMVKNSPEAMHNQHTDIQKLFEETQPKWNIAHVNRYVPPQLDGSYSEKMQNAINAAALHGGTDMNNPAAKSALMDKLDGYIKENDPELWKQKQYVDWSTGTLMPGAGNMYGGLMSPFVKVHNTLGTLGMAVGAAGLGLTGYGLYKMIKNRLAKKKTQVVK